MARITNRDILDEFIMAFENGKPFTSSEKKLAGIQLSQLRKTVKQYLEDAKIETDLSINEIIMDEIKYAVMSDKKFRRVASLGYDILGESIEFWEKRRKIIKKRANQKESKKVEKLDEKCYNTSIVNDTSPRKPKWLGNDDDEW